MTNSSPWLYNGIEIEDSQIPKKAIAFVYKITRIADGKYYYGKKLLFFTKTSIKTITHKDGTKKKKKVKTLVPSDWRDYWSSSSEVIENVRVLGSSAFLREILLFVENKGSASYYELRYQMDSRALENREKSFNGIVNARVNWAHIRPPL